MEKKNIKIIISGGGTGGHIFPALSIANALRRINPEVEILFVGAEGRMEMEKVPAAGYKIIGLPVVGFQRKLTVKNLSFVFKLVKSMRLASKIIKEFKPDVAIGVGGYASGPILKMAQRKGIPTLIQEQNSYAGVTNKLLAKRANAICVAYEGMEKYFPKEKIIITGNPVREGLNNIDGNRKEGLKFFNVPNGNKVVLVVGGSLGARTINESILGKIDKIETKSEVTLLWQTGKLYYNNVQEKVLSTNPKNISVFDFIHRMDLAYSVADLVVSRAGAGTISELCLVGKPTILIPSPNVAEDHQTMNAKALVKKDAAIMVNDKDAPGILVETITKTLFDNNALEMLATNIKSMAMENSDVIIAEKVFEIVKK